MMSSAIAPSNKPPIPLLPNNGLAAKDTVFVVLL